MSLLRAEFIKLFKMASSIFSTKLTTLSYLCRNRMADLNMNVTVNTSEYFRLADFMAILYLMKMSFSLFLRS
jgi:hypothetical protein